VLAPLRKPALFSLGLLLLLLPAAAAKFLTDDRSPESPQEVVRSYLKAIHSRDPREAYRFISSADGRLFDQESYVQAQAQLGGFTLQLARQLTAEMEIKVVERETKDHRARLTIDYKLPAADELAGLLYNWDQEKLNALPRAEQRRIIDALEKIKKARGMITTEGRETYELIKEDGKWKIFLDWASKIQVSFDAAVPNNSAVDVDVLTRKLFASVDEPFQTSLKVRNRGGREVVARIEHRIEPKESAGQVAMIACGFLRPLTLQPGEVREVSSAYLLDPGFAKNTALSITFVFDLASAPRADNLGRTVAGDRR